MTQAHKCPNNSQSSQRYAQVTYVRKFSSVPEVTKLLWMRPAEEDPGATRESGEKERNISITNLRSHLGLKLSRMDINRMDEKCLT